MANQIAFEALTVSTSAKAPTAATVSQLAKAAIFMVDPTGEVVRWRADGTDPTSSVGWPLIPGVPYVLVGNAHVLNSRFIRTGSNDVTVYAAYYDAVDIVAAGALGSYESLASPNLRIALYAGATLIGQGDTSGLQVQGPAAEDAAVAGNPVRVGGQYDSSRRSLDTGDIGTPALASDASALVKPEAKDDAGNVATQIRSDDRGVQYQRQIGQGPVHENNIPLALQITGTLTTAIQASALDYLAKSVIVTPDVRNTDAATLIGDSQAQHNTVNKGTSLVMPGPIFLKNLYAKAYTTAGDDVGVLAFLADRPDFRQLILEAIRANGGAYWPLEERTGTAIADLGKDQKDLLLSSATVGDAGVFGHGIDFDGSNDYLRQKTEQAESGTVSGVETNGSAALDDTGAVFSSTIRDGKHWIRITDATGRVVHGYIGTADPDADDTRIQIYSTAARSTQNLVEGGATSFDMADTPLTYHVFKELAKAPTALTVGCWVGPDEAAAAVTLITAEPASGTTTSFLLRALSSGAFELLVRLAPNTFQATGSLVRKAGRQYFVVGTYEASTAATLYVHGVQDAKNTTSIPASLNECRDPVSLGAHQTLITPGGFFNGRISHPFIIEATMDANWVRTAYELSRR